MSLLPIETVIADIQSGLTRSRALVLQAPPGAGKTTRVPLALLNQPWMENRSIILLEPRRLAARAAATRMAELLHETVGGQVGYRIRFEHKVSPQTRIEVITEGILTRRLHNDPALEDVGLVIFDEFHERSLHTDLALALCLESQHVLRPDLRLLVMSATLDGETVAHLLDNAPLLTSQGRCYPVTVHYLPRDPDGPIAPAVVSAILRALSNHSGDILAFLPGGGEIRQAQHLLEQEPLCAQVGVYQLYGDLPHADQQRAIQPDRQGRRKVVLATAIAETSLTIEGIRVVIDAGWSRVPRFEPRSCLTRLDTVRVSADSAEQRTGRAGRLGPGVCYRLWSEATQQALRPHRVPEILEADLAPLALDLALWGTPDVTQLAWLNPPPTGALAQAHELLAELEALDAQGSITPSGRELATWPLHPRLAHMLQRAVRLGLGDVACHMAALLEERDILRGEKSAGCDLSVRLEALQAYRKQGRPGALRFSADPAACARVEQAVRQWRAKLELPRTQANAAIAGETVGLLLAFAYPDRIAKRRQGEMNRYLLANGRGARLKEDDPMVGTDWLVVAHLDADSSEGRIYLAAPVALADLETQLATRIRDEEVIAWDPRQDVVVARRERRLDSLVLASQALPRIDSAQLRQALVEGIRRMGLACLPWTREIREWQARVLSLRVWCPDEGWPDVSDTQLTATLEDWLAPYLDGMTRREHLQGLQLGRILGDCLHWSLRQRLDIAAPTHIQVPSGSRLWLEYRPGQAPVLAVKLQEMFGLADTPRVADGKIPITLHLLSPAQRPIQITQDLRGFWERTYADVKKELKGRYPKHPWPDDPWGAQPSRGIRRVR